MTIVLTLPDQTVAHDATVGKNGEGVFYLPESTGLDSCVLARLERSEGLKLWDGSLDAIHLSRYCGTDYVRWWGRAADGAYYPIGRFMQAVRTSKRRVWKLR